MQALELLLIEDDQQMADLLVKYLNKEGIKVSHLLRPSQALASLAVNTFDLIILDLSLPEMDGLELCKKIRKMTDVYIIISSARSDIDDKLQGLENGADDYLPKPYDPRELLARIKTVMKRSGSVSTVDEETGMFRIDDSATQIFKEGKLLDLTLAEFEILRLMIKNPNRTISRVDIANSMDTHRFESGIESINILVGRLRKKIGSQPLDQYIQTVRGVGYRFVEN